MEFEGSIIRKFNKLSSKEWLQYFQFKLSPEREKELIDYSQYDPFLKDALDAFNDQSIRPVALQSYNFLLNSIRNHNGESTLNTNVKRNITSIVDYKKILLILGLLIGIIGLGFLTKYAVESISSDDNSINEEDTSSMEAIETDINDSDINAPIEAIPNTESSSQVFEEITPAPTSNNQNTSSNTTTNRQSTSSPSTTPQIEEESTTPEAQIEETTTAQANSSPEISFDKENRLFQKAQQLYTQGKYTESKQILQSLSSYDNPKRSQAKEILKNLQ